MSLKINLTNSAGSADVLGVFVVSNDVTGQINNLSVEVDNLEQLLKEKKFKGDKSSVLYTRLRDQKFKYLVVAGLGKGDVISVETFRRALAKLVRSVECLSVSSLEIIMPDEKLFDASADYMVEQAVVTAQIANHKFDTYLSDKGKKEVCADLNFVVSNTDELDASFKKAELTGQAVNKARQWVDMPSNHLRPVDLADEAVKIAKAQGMKVTVFDEPEVEKMGMGGLHAVSKGSDEDCRFVVMEYDCGDKSAPTIALVGKGIMYDTGGISLKPSQYMETMKEDMSGAAAVISSMEVIAQLKPKVNVIGCTPLAENMPSGRAGRPGDIVKFYNGKTAEVKNTDAEGRLVLADALSYVVKHFDLAAVVDIATLTGACEYALGPFYSALISEHDDVAEKVKDAASESGDFVWQLPLTDDYKVAMKSEVADMSNIASPRYKAGTISAACFLQHFVGDTPWVHLDIANTAFNIGMLPYYRADSATGSGVRLFVELAMKWK